jgi:cobalt/nickel transport system permease protein
VGGAVLAVLMAWLGSRRLRDEEIPRIAVMSSAFFVASLIHVPVPLAGTSAHMLLNGLVGIILGPRAALAIPLALFLQCILLGHGGLYTLGVNTCLMTVPALTAWWVFRQVRSAAWLRSKRWLSVVGFLVGGLGVLATAALLFLTLLLGGNEDWLTLATLAFVCHLPLAGIEAFIMATTVSFLARVKPEMLGLKIVATPLPTPPETAVERQAG